MIKKTIANYRQQLTKSFGKLNKTHSAKFGQFTHSWPDYDPTYLTYTVVGYQLPQPHLLSNKLDYKPTIFGTTSNLSLALPAPILEKESFMLPITDSHRVWVSVSLHNGASDNTSKKIKATKYQYVPQL